MPLASFSVTVAAAAPPRVEINGWLLPDAFTITGIGLNLEQGMPILNLAVLGEGTVEGEGIVVVHSQGDDEMAFLRRWLSHLDPEELDRLALEHAPTLDSQPGEGYKAALLELAGE